MYGDVYSAWTGIHMEYHSNNTAKWTTKIEQFVGQNIYIAAHMRRLHNSRVYIHNIGGLKLSAKGPILLLEAIQALATALGQLADLPALPHWSRVQSPSILMSGSLLWGKDIVGKGLLLGTSHLWFCWGMCPLMLQRGKEQLGAGRLPAGQNMSGGDQISPLCTE